LTFADWRLLKFSLIEELTHEIDVQEKILTNHALGLIESFASTA
jgi:hypothetical protein